jgi:hypothetical protein
VKRLALLAVVAMLPLAEEPADDCPFDRIEARALARDLLNKSLKKGVHRGTRTQERHHQERQHHVR